MSELMEQAQELMLWGKYQDARDIFLAMKAEDRSNPEISYYLGLCDMGDEAWESALEHFSDCLEQAPHYVDADLDAGEALLALEREEEALARFTRVLAANPDHPRALLSLARYHDYTENWEKAVEYYERTLSLGDGWDSPRFELALAYIKVERFLEADLMLEGIITESLKRGTQAFMGEWAPGSREDLARSISEMREERIEVARLFEEKHAWPLSLARTMYKAIALLSQGGAERMTEVWRELGALRMVGMEFSPEGPSIRLNSLGASYAPLFLSCLQVAIQQELKLDGMVAEDLLGAWNLARSLFS